MVETSGVTGDAQHHLAGPVGCKTEPVDREEEGDGYLDGRSEAAESKGCIRFQADLLNGHHTISLPRALPPNSFPATSPVTPPGQKSESRRKPQEFNARMSLKGYLAQFELLAHVQGWG